jgi:wyosine [tRNA(Phe)-imidazoG37] synthetase (radical SAM superfamily)
LLQKTFHEEAAMPVIAADFCSVYGPVESWRYGRSLGIDPIGPISACSFNCVYCQLGEIEQPTDERQLFIPTAQILADLQAFAPWAGIESGRHFAARENFDAEASWRVDEW